MKKTYWAIGAGLVAILPVTANAALITKRYEISANFDTGSKASIVSAFDVTYDPSSTKPAYVAVTNLASDGGDAFTKPAGYYAYTAPSAASGFREDRLVYVGGNEDASLTRNTNDFRIVFDVTAAGDLAGYSEVTYTTSSGERYMSSSETIRDITAAVPEPATWAMMLVGFGMIGATTRYRRKARTVSFA